MKAIGFEYFKLARSVLKIGSFEFINLKYFNSTFMNLKIARLVLNAKCKIVVFTQCSRQLDRKSTRLNSSHTARSRMPSSA